MIDGTGAKFAIKLFGSQTSEVVNVVRPQVKNIIATESVKANVLIQTREYPKLVTDTIHIPISLFNYDDLGSQELCFYGGPEAARTTPDDEYPLAGTHFSPAVALVSGSLVKLGPKCLSFPCVELRPQLGIEVRKLCGLQPKDFTQHSEAPQHRLQCVGLTTEVVE